MSIRLRTHQFALCSVSFIIEFALSLSSFFFFNDTATTEIYTLSLHDALPIYCQSHRHHRRPSRGHYAGALPLHQGPAHLRSEEHTSELQSHLNLVCRLLLEKKKHKISGCRLDKLPSRPRIYHQGVERPIR